MFYWGFDYSQPVSFLTSMLEEPLELPVFLAAASAGAEVTPTARMPATTVPITRNATVRLVRFMASSSSSRSHHRSALWLKCQTGERC